MVHEILLNSRDEEGSARWFEGDLSEETGKKDPKIIGTFNGIDECGVQSSEELSEKKGDETEKGGRAFFATLFSP